MYHLQFSTRPEQTARIIVVLAICWLLLAVTRMACVRRYMIMKFRSKFATCQCTMSVCEH